MFTYKPSVHIEIEINYFFIENKADQASHFSFNFSFFFFPNFSQRAFLTFLPPSRVTVKISEPLPRILRRGPPENPLPLLFLPVSPPCSVLPSPNRLPGSGGPRPSPSQFHNRSFPTGVFYLLSSSPSVARRSWCAAPSRFGPSLHRRTVGSSPSWRWGRSFSLSPPQIWRHDKLAMNLN